MIFIDALDANVCCLSQLRHLVLGFSLEHNFLSNMPFEGSFD